MLENLDFSRAVIENYDDVKITFESGSSNVVINGNVGEIIRGEEDSEGIVYATITKDGVSLVILFTLLNLTSAVTYSDFSIFLTRDKAPELCLKVRTFLVFPKTSALEIYISLLLPMLAVIPLGFSPTTLPVKSS